MSKREPPKVLIETWIRLMNSSESEEVKNRAREMLYGAFPDTGDLVSYCLKNKIKMQ